MRIFRQNAATTRDNASPSPRSQKRLEFRLLVFANAETATGLNFDVIPELSEIGGDQIEIPRSSVNFNDGYHVSRQCYIAVVLFTKYGIEPVS